MSRERTELEKSRDCYADIFDRIHGLEGLNRRSITYIKLKDAIEKEEYDAECRAEALAS